MTETRLSKQQLAEIRAQLGDTKPATDGLIVQLAEGASDYAAYRRRETEGANSFYGLNLTGFMGERMGVVLRRLLDAEAEVERLRAAEHTDWRAWHDSDASMPLGQYIGRGAAMGHVHHVLAREESVPVAEIETRVRWVADDPHGPEDELTAWECWLTDEDGADETPTGYVVSPIPVAVAYTATPAELDARAEAEFVAEAGHGAVEPDERVVAYRSADGVLYCVAHDRPGDVPRTSEDLPDGGLCAACGVDVLIAGDTEGGEPR